MNLPRESEDELRGDMSGSPGKPATRNRSTRCYGHGPVQLAGTAIALSGLLLVACTGHSAKPSAAAEVRSEGPTKPSPSSEPEPRPQTRRRAPELSAERQVLSEGYSLLYSDSKTFSGARLLLYVKFESEEFDQLLEAISAFGSALNSELERIARDYPGVRIDLDPLPVLEKRKRIATGLDKVLDSVPVVGMSGPEYERTFLISISNGLNQERHLAAEMVKVEPDPGLRKYLTTVQERMDLLFERTERLLRTNYYRPLADD